MKARTVAVLQMRFTCYSFCLLLGRPFFTTHRPSRKHTTPPRVGTRSRMASHSRSVASVPHRAAPPAPTVAFLFTLRRDRHPLGRAWNAFFRTCPKGTARVHVHTDPNFKPRSTGNRTLGGQGAFTDAVIPTPKVHIARFGYSMVQGRLNLMRYASTVSPPADWFLFFSESDAPLRSCPDAMRYLAKHAGSSFAYSDHTPTEQLQAGAWGWEQTFRTACPLCAAANISAATYRHGPGWVGLHRAHALPIMRREQAHEPAFAEGYDWKLLGVPDEWYWTTLVEALGRRADHILTYMEPGSAETGHSKTFRVEDLPRLVAKARSTPPSFFARKFPTTPQMDEALVRSLVSMRFPSRDATREPA